MAYLDKSELKDTYYEASQKAEAWHKPFNEYERLAGNKISATIGKNMPKVNDGSLASALLETPMVVLPSMQTGTFTSNERKEKWLNEIANIIWRERIVPNARTQASFFDKEQIALYRALKYGAQPRYNFFVSTERYTGSDWSLPYIKNLKLEPGKFSVDDCDYVFLDIYFTKLQLKNIIEQQKSEAAIAKEEGRKPDTSWDIKELQKLVDMALTSKEIKEQNINERDKQIHASGIKLTACFQRGIGAKFYMLSSQIEGDGCVREWTNPDPTGDLPITMQYCFETLETPYGIGRVELAGPTQNVLDFMTQAHVLATQIGLQPPKKITGPVDTTNLSSIVHAPDALWQMGSAQIDVVQTATSVYSQFPANFGLYKAQLQNLQGRTDGTVSSESGDPGYSKTQAGVQLQQSRTNAQDNYLRNKADSASARMAEKMMNVHMNMMQGADIIDIAQEDADRLKKAGFIDDNPETLEPAMGELPIIYDAIRSTFRFEYDPRPEADEDDKNRWVELINIATSNPNIIPAMQASGWDFNLGEAFKKVIAASGANDWDKVLTETNPQDAQIDPTTGQPMAVDGNGADSEAGVAEGQSVDEQSPARQEILMTMGQYGIDEDEATAVVAARRQGYQEEEIANFLRKRNDMEGGGE